MQERASRRAFFGLAGRGAVAAPLIVMATRPAPVPAKVVKRAEPARQIVHLAGITTDSAFRNQTVRVSGIVKGCFFENCTLLPGEPGAELQSCHIDHCRSPRPFVDLVILNSVFTESTIPQSRGQTMYVANHFQNCGTMNDFYEACGAWR